MSWASAILGILTAIPDMVKLGNESLTFVKSILGDTPSAYIKNVGSALAQLNAAGDDENLRQQAAKALADAIQGL